MSEPIDITPGSPIPPADPAAARRRMRIALLAAGAVASVVAGGGGYAALSLPAERHPAVLRVVPVPVLPVEGNLLPAAEAVPGAAPVVKSAARPAPATTRAKPSRTQPAQTAVPLTAWYSGGGEWRSDGLHRYGGSVRLGDSEEWATGWRVRLTVPGGNPVHADGDVTVRQRGERVVFAPGPDGGLTFDFWIDGVLPAEPYGCLVNRHACELAPAD